VLNLRLILSFLLEFLWFIHPCGKAGSKLERHFVDYLSRLCGIRGGCESLGSDRCGLVRSCRLQCKVGLIAKVSHQGWDWSRPRF
jgi:hypothetical protein